MKENWFFLCKKLSLGHSFWLRILVNFFLSIIDSHLAQTCAGPMHAHTVSVNHNHIVSVLLCLEETVSLVSSMSSGFLPSFCFLFCIARWALTGGFEEDSWITECLKVSHSLYIVQLQICLIVSIYYKGKLLW